MSAAHLRFTFTCQRCGSVLEAVGDMCGQSGRCPTCGAVFVIPPVDANTGLATEPARVAEDGQLPTPMHAYATAGGKAPRIRTRPGGEQVIVCPRCGRDTGVDANTCSGCGLPFTMEGAAAVAQTAEGTSTLATWSLTVGVLSVLTFCFPALGPVAIGLGVSAIRRSSLYGQAQSGRSMAIAGIICGCASLIFCAIWVFARYYL